MIAGTASGSSTANSWRRLRVPHPVRGLEHVARDAVEPGEHVPHEDQQRVGGERDDRRVLRRARCTAAAARTPRSTGSCTGSRSRSAPGRARRGSGARAARAGARARDPTAATSRRASGARRSAARSRSCGRRPTTSRRACRRRMPRAPLRHHPRSPVTVPGPSPTGTCRDPSRIRHQAFPNGNVAVHDLSLDVPEGEVCVLVGPSGCGKTTTLRMINRLIEPTSGRIFLDDEDVTHAKPVELRRRMGYVIQQVGLFPHQTIGTNVATVPHLLGWNRDKTQGPGRRAARAGRARSGRRTAAATPRSSPAGSANASASRARSPRTRRCC